MNNNNQDHTVLITICVLMGVIVTCTVAIIGSIYNNGKNIERDKYLFAHCQNVTKDSTEGVLAQTIKYKCGS